LGSWFRACDAFNQEPRTKKPRTKMPVFAYKAIDPRGSENAGVITADSRSAAVDAILRLGVTPVTIKESSNSVDVIPAAKAAALNGKVSNAKVENFTRGLASLLAAGVPLSRSLNIVIREQTHPVARAQWTAIHDDVVGGTSLGDAMAKFPRTFPSVYVAMVR